MFFEELKIGMKKKLAPVVIDKEEMLDFALKYDNVPLHTDEKYAESTHFGKLLAPGVMAYLVVWAKYLEVDFWGTELLAGKSSKIEWFKPVFARDELTGVAEITALTERNSKNGTAELTIDIFNQNGEMVMKNITEAVVMKRLY